MLLRSARPVVSFTLAFALIASMALPRDAAARQPAAASPAEGGLVVPPLPEGTPEELLAFVEGLLPPKQQPKSREEMMNYFRGVSKLGVEAAGKALAQVKEGDPLYEKASRLQLSSLSNLSRLGDEGAAEALTTFAAQLATSSVPSLALEGKRMLIVADAQKMFASEDFSNAGAVITKTAELLAADPSDLQTAGLAMQLAGALEQSGDSTVAVTAIKTFGPLFAKSDNPKVRELAESFQAKLRLLELPGNPMEISGTLLDGTPFDQKKLAGQVILVDFWATWCGPCIAEMPNMLAAYEKYHDKGFEVVGISLDEERGDVEKFVADKKLPWPILFAGKGWQDPVAQFYGISGIPQLVLIGRDGNVITTDVRGEKLGERLSELFGDSK